MYLFLFLINFFNYSVIFDVSSIIVLGPHEPHPYMIPNLVDKRGMYSNCSINWWLPHLSPSAQASLFLETTILKSDQVVTLHWPLSVQVRAELYVSDFKSKARNY